MGILSYDYAEGLDECPDNFPEEKVLLAAFQNCCQCCEHDVTKSCYQLRSNFNKHADSENTVFKLERYLCANSNSKIT